MSISIVIPTHNSALWLPATLRSCLEQTRLAKEILLVDDGSTDHTETLATAFAGKVRYIRLTNGGVSRARNEGARRTSGEWLLFLDSDDILLPHALETLYRAALESEAGVAYGMVILRQSPPEQPRLHGLNFAAGPPPHPALLNLHRSVITTPGAALVRRDLHERTGGFVSGLEPMEDRDFWIKCGLLAPFAFADTVVLDKTWRPGSAGSHMARKILRGLHAQLSLAAWCRARGINPAFHGLSDRQFVAEALREAIWSGSHSILPDLLHHARETGYRGRHYWEAKIRAWGWKR